MRHFNASIILLTPEIRGRSQLMVLIQHRGIQSALDLFQNYHFCEDYTNLYWTQMFHLEFLEINISKFSTFPLHFPSLANFCDVLKQSCLYLAVLEVLTYYVDT